MKLNMTVKVGVRIAAVSSLALFGASCVKAPKPGAPDVGAAAATGGAGAAAASWKAEPAEHRAAAERELAEQVDLLRRTGPATAAVDRSFASLLAQLRVRLQSSTHAQFLDGPCFRGGCTFAMRFPKPAPQVPLETIDTALLQDEGFAKWPGGKFRSGVFSSDQKTDQVTWILFLDDVPASAVTPPSAPH